jgi:hypothetical protein
MYSYILGTIEMCRGRFCYLHAKELHKIRRRIKRAQNDKLIHIEIQARKAEMELRGACDFGHQYRLRVLNSKIQ